MLRAFPMILIAVVAYNVIVLGGMAAGQSATALLDSNLSLTMFSGDAWRISTGDGLLTLALAMLFVETVKAANSTHREILNHAMSMLTFVAALVEFIVLKGFGTSTFFLITMMCLFDVVAGYTISIITAKRDLTMAPHEDRY
ncbi:MAG TPA: hypothetical protein VFQ69_03350 [Rhizomicrobium sp.]|jgi:hypothetical protein|nr:hypothetical protein [Rhizomicrobium sp.]